MHFFFLLTTTAADTNVLIAVSSDATVLTTAATDVGVRQVQLLLQLKQLLIYLLRLVQPLIQLF